MARQATGLELNGKVCIMSAANTFSKVENSVRTRLEPVVAQASASWRRLSTRERNLLILAACIVLVALIWMVGLKPALNEVRKANGQLPVLQSQTSRLDAILLEAKALERGRSGQLSFDETGAALQASLVSTSLDGLSSFSTSNALPAGWEIRFTNAPAGRLIDWLSNLPYVARVKTVSVDLARSNVDGRDRPGQLSGTVVLALPSQETP